jgi:hypothetical protein
MSSDAEPIVQVLQQPRAKSAAYRFVRTFHILASITSHRREPRRGATCKMRLPVKLQRVKPRALPRSSVSFRAGDPYRDASGCAFRSRTAKRSDLKTGDTWEGFDV